MTWIASSIPFLKTSWGFKIDICPFFFFPPRCEESLQLIVQKMPLAKPQPSQANMVLPSISFPLSPSFLAWPFFRFLFPPSFFFLSRFRRVLPHLSSPPPCRPFRNVISSVNPSPSWPHDQQKQLRYRAAGPSSTIIVVKQAPCLGSLRPKPLFLATAAHFFPPLTHPFN